MECFTVMSEEIEERIDPYFYRPEFKLMYKKLSKVKLVSFGEIIKTLINGFDYRDFTEEGLTYLRVSNIKPFEFCLDEVKKISPDFNIAKKIKLEKGNLLITRKGTFGVALSLDKDENFIISSEIFKIELLENINPKFIEIILNSSIGQKQFDKYKIGAIMGSLSQEAIKQIKIPLPPLETQNKIVQLMNKSYSSKKSKEAESQQLLDSINNYVLNELGIKLPELKDKMIYVVDSEEVQNKRADAYYYQPKFEEVEKAVKKGKFEVKGLKGIVAELLSGQRPKGGVRQINEGVPSLGGEHVLSDGKIATTDLKFIPKEFHKRQLKSKVQKRDIIIVKDGATTGKVGIIPEDYPFEEANINEHVFLLRVKKDINPYYVFSIIKSKLGQVQISREITGGTIMGIIRETTESLKIPLPPLAVQNKIAEEVKKRMQKAEQLQKEAKEELEKAKLKLKELF